MAKKTTTSKSGSRGKSKTVKTKATKAPVKTTTGDLVVMDNEDKDILSSICQDLDNGDIGQFYRGRACVGLVLLKERCPHGLYETTTAEAMPMRSPRTIRRYYSEGKKFLDANNLKASAAYAQMKSFDPVKALAQGPDGRLLLGSGDDGNGVAEVPQAVEALANKINDQIKEKNNGGPDKKPPKKLTRAQKRDAAASDLTLAVGKVNIALNGDWTLVDTETLDTVSASLTVSAATIKEELKKRG